MRQYAKIGLKIVQIITHSLSGSKKQAQKRRWFARKDLIFLLILAVISIAAFLTPASNDLVSSNAVASLGGIGELPALPADEVQLPSRVPEELLITTGPLLTSAQPQVRTLWGFGVIIVDVFLAVIFAFNGLRIIITGSVFRYADAAESIGRILLAIVVAHMSLTFVGMFIDTSSIASREIANAASSSSFGLHSERMPTDVTMAGVLDDLVRSAMSMSPLMLGPIGVGASYGLNPLDPIGTVRGLFDLGGDLISGGPQEVLTHTFNTFFGALPRMLLKLVALVLMWAFIAQLLIRILLIDLYIVISAPCIACWALPGQSGQPVTRFWLQGIVSTVLVQILQVGGLIVSQILFDNLFDLLASNLTDMGFNNLLPYILYIGVLWFLLRLPSLLRTSTTQMIQAGGQTVVNAAGAAASTAISAATTAVTAAGAVVMIAR